MTNVEKHLDKLKNLRDNFAVGLNNNITGCSQISCENCKFYDKWMDDCNTSRLDWLFQECQSELNETEKILIDHAGILRNVKYKYIARDKSGSLFLYTKQPKKSNNLYCTQGSFLNISEKLFPWIQYSDGIYDIKAKSFIERQ